MSRQAARSASADERRELRFAIEEFNADYASTLDAYDLDGWVEYFTEDALYRITARENFDQNLPLGLVYCEGRGMLKDRALAILKTTTFAPRYLRHFLGPARILNIAEDGAIEARANYMVVQTELDRPSAILQAGEYVDRFARQGGVVRLRERHCVYDSLIIPNALVFPV